MLIDFCFILLVVISSVFPLCCEVKGDFLKKDEKSFGMLRKVCIFALEEMNHTTLHNDSFLNVSLL